MKKFIIGIFLCLAACGGAGSSSVIDEIANPSTSVRDLDGTWSLQINGCSGTYIWDESIGVSYTTDLSDGYELYTINSDLGTYTGVYNTTDGSFYACLFPEGETSINECDILCTGTASDAQANFSCETDTSHLHLCGDVIYTIN